MKSKRSAEAAQRGPRRPGRPRADGRPQISREDVFWTAAKLMAQNGFSGTSIRMIADQLGAGPASIFNLFNSKDQILNDLIEWGLAPSFAFHQQILQRHDPPAVALFKSIYEEALVVASLDQDYPAVFYLPELRRPGFERAAAARLQMIAHYRLLIEAGIKAGLFVDETASLMAEQCFQLTETTVLAADKVSAMAPQVFAQSAARFCLRALLLRPQLLPEIEAAAAVIPLTIDMHETPQ